MELKDRYRILTKQVDALIEGEPDKIANLSNIVAAIKENFQWFWIGFYLVKGDELVLGPFQGPVACTRISRGRGVCGSAWADSKSLLVPDVREFPGHIACSALSESEVVVPILSEGEVVLILDVDSDKKEDFSEADVDGLERVGKIIGTNWRTWS